MSNIDIISNLYKYFGEKNIDELRTICLSNITWKQNPGFPFGAINVGIPNIIKNVFEANASRWASFNFKIHNMHEAGDVVTVQGLYIVKSKIGKLAEAQTCHVFELINGKVSSFQQYTDSKILWDCFGPNVKGVI